MVKSVLLNDEDYELLMKARAELMKRGFGSLDDKVLIEKAEKRIKNENLTRGAIVGLAAEILLHMLTKNHKGDDEHDTNQKQRLRTCS
ncbi:hypothetical protein K8R43_02365 [archaeon]|nr:hypothetical protein [archaeon]